MESLGGGAGSSTGGGNRKGEKRPPIANEFALGYTYLDVLDADHEGCSFLPNHSLHSLIIPSV